MHSYLERIDLDITARQLAALMMHTDDDGSAVQTGLVVLGLAD